MSKTGLPLTDAQLSAAPFHLDRKGLEWVKTRFSAFGTEAKIAQLLLPMCRDLSDDGIDALTARGLGGVHRFPSYGEEDLRRSAERLMQASAVPPPDSSK